jgi:hypothetical protein
MHHRAVFAASLLAAAAAAAAAAGCKRKFDIAKYVSWVNKEVRSAVTFACQPQRNLA